MDKREKQETLSKLYSLRAGLSLIAQKKEEVDNILQNRSNISDQLNKTVKSEEDKLQSEKDIAFANEHHITWRIDGKQAEIDERKADIKKLEKDNQEIKKGSTLEFDFLLRLVGMAIGIAIMVGLGVTQFTNPENETFDFVLVGIFFTIGAIITIVCLIPIIIMARDSISEISRNSEAILKKESEISENRRTIAQYKEQITSNRVESAKKQEELQKNIVAVRQATQLVSALTDAVAVEMLNTHKETAVGIYNSLSEEYSELLDERDWQYVDLFIYMYETGRADSKKEALQLIDQYQQNKNIVEAIESAGREIQGSIRQGLGALQTSMERQFKALSGQLYQMHSETMLKMDRITNLLDNLNSEMSRLSMDMSQMSSELEGMQQQLNLNTALQAKANVSSRQLMEDVKYMRTLDEQAEIRRRNGLNSYGQYS